VKFRRSDEYKGTIDPVMLQKMKEFFAKGEIDMNKAQLGYKCFVLAPPKAFNLIDRPVPRPPDPILFYKLDEKHYKLIHKWGADLTPFRRLLGWKYKNEGTYFLWYLILTTIPCISLMKYDGFETWLSAAGIVLTAAGLVISLVRIANDEFGGKFYRWSELWNDHYKPKV